MMLEACLLCSLWAVEPDTARQTRGKVDSERSSPEPGRVGGATADGALEAPPRGWAFVPAVGVGLHRDGGSWSSAGVEVGLALQHRVGLWLGSVQGSLRGLGVACSAADLLPGEGSEGCSDNPTSVALGGARSMGRFRVGAGVGGIRRTSGGWHAAWFGRLTAETPPFEIDLRVEVSRGPGPRVYVPVTMGLSLG